MRGLIAGYVIALHFMSSIKTLLFGQPDCIGYDDTSYTLEIVELLSDHC